MSFLIWNRMEFSRVSSSIYLLFFLHIFVSGSFIIAIKYFFIKNFVFFSFASTFPWSIAESIGNSYCSLLILLSNSIDITYSFDTHSSFNKWETSFNEVIYNMLFSNLFHVNVCVRISVHWRINASSFDQDILISIFSNTKI